MQCNSVGCKLHNADGIGRSSPAYVEGDSTGRVDLVTGAANGIELAEAGLCNAAVSSWC